MSDILQNNISGTGPDLELPELANSGGGSSYNITQQNPTSVTGSWGGSARR